MREEEEEKEIENKKTKGQGTIMVPWKMDRANSLRGLRDDR